MRSCYSHSSIRGISRAAWRHAVATTPSLTGGSHQHHEQENMRHLPLRRPAPPNALGLAERLFSSSSSTKKSAGKKSGAKKDTPGDSAGREDPFYVVRKGDVTGIYKNLADCQEQVSNSVCEPYVTVFKGYSLRKETEEYLAARGLKNSLYSINGADARDELFGALAPCPFQQPDGNATSTLERPHETLIFAKKTGPSKKHPKVDELEPLPDSHLSCILEVDGACEGNPGKSGAGVIVRRPDGSVIAQLREGLGMVTLNTAGYRALLLGLRYAAKKGFKYIRAQADSQNVCKQAQDLWRPKSDHMVDLCKQVKQEKGSFLQFQITQVLSECNVDADAQAKLAVKLPLGGIQEQSNLVACPFQQPDGNATSTLERPQETETGLAKMHPKVAELEPLPDSNLSCILEYDGACLGNPNFPRKSGAGVIVRRTDGSVIAQLREGLGSVTECTAEYRALLLGLRYAAKKGFKYIHAQGNSEHVCKQVQGVWLTKRDHIVDLCNQVKQMKGRFLQFQITLVLRKFNLDADAQARLAVELPVGGIQELPTVAC